MPGGRVARVAIDSPLPQLDQLFDYAVPEALADQAVAGAAVRVPLRSGGRLARGWIVELADQSAYEGRLSEVEEVTTLVPVLAPEVWALARRVADRAAGSASDVLRLAIPPRYVRVEKSWAKEHPAGAERPAAPEATDAPGEPDALDRAVADRARIALQALPGVTTLDGGATVGRWATTLASAAARVLARGESTIIAVPDHRDLAQLEQALHAVAPADRITRVDAGQTGGARYRGFLDCLDGTPRVVIGNRSAVYAPAARLGLIALWDDGDPLHAEPLSPGVHARDAALVRQEQSGAALVFSAHARSTEVQRLVGIGWCRQVEPERIARPRIVVDEAGSDPGTARIPSAAWRAARDAAREGPVLLQVARPGYAAALACARCGAPATCAACGGGLEQRGPRTPPACRVCGTHANPFRCAECEGERLRMVTVGTERTAEELGRAFPGTRVIVSDGARPLTEVGPEPALVIATRGAEPVAAGGYRAVLLLDGERMLLREALRVSEDCVRWWADAAALAADDAPVHLVGVRGRIATALATWTLAAWAEEELTARRELRFPPAVRVATVTARGPVLERPIAELRALGEGVDVLGPVPVDDGLERVVVRMDYGRAQAVAASLRASMIRVATERRRPVQGQPVRRPPTLRVRFDDLEAFG
ncbi:putative primosomal protein N' [Agromyces rhizosphaerae]|uniref:Probable replication restart protein PriA n=1 Tax=Agromyces rhizosphaerae TaxID=88374 RepID=A0A9W6CUQ4_9MICO|nr:primosomal protein N' [Agromyces rhizosphaerae]GLI28813.1 putative primosomal protein N' [Agromyces rhizosphaerae]